VTEATLSIDNLAIPVETAGPSRRARLTMERDGSLTLRAAADVSPDELRAFVASRRRWIYRKLAEKEALSYTPVTKELTNGEGFAYLGRSSRLLIADSDRVKLQHGRLLLPLSQRDQGHDAIIAWYRERGRAWLPKRVRDWATRLRVEIVDLDVRDLGHKWGSADPQGRVAIHWATMQLRPPLIDYVLAHELAHLREPHHGPAFWHLVARVQPDYEDRKAELAEHGATLWVGALETTARSWPG